MSDDLIKEKFNNHEERISQLEKNTKILQTMDWRLGQMEGNIKSINNKLDNKDENYSAQCSQFIWGTGASWGSVVTLNSSSTMTVRGYDVYSRSTGTNCRIGWFAIGRWK